MHQPHIGTRGGEREGDANILHVRNRPKLVLKVSPRAPHVSKLHNPVINNLQFVHDGTYLDSDSDLPSDSNYNDETDAYYNDCSGSDTEHYVYSPLDSDSDDGFLLLHKAKRQARRSRREQHKKSKMRDTAAWDILEPQPANRARYPGRGFGQHVGFLDTIEVFELPIEADNNEEEGPTAMERMMELDRLKQWVQERSSEEFGEMGWVRRLVELEMAEML
jgi:hypothetical protein